MRFISVATIAACTAMLVACGGSSSNVSPPVNTPSSSAATSSSSAATTSSSSAATTSSSSPAVSSSANSSAAPVMTALPFHEDFDHVVDVDGFFSTAYRALATEEAPFYYRSGGYPEFSAGQMTIGNARFTLGNRTPTIETTETDTQTTGEFDLSAPYRVSFCVVDWAVSEGTPTLQFYVDNNTTGQANAIHGGGTTGSRIYSQALDTLAKGQRVGFNATTGSTESFLQLRVENNGTLTMDDLWIGYQSDTSTEPTACGEASEPPVSTPFFEESFGVDKVTFFSVDHKALQSDATKPMYLITGGGSNIELADGTIQLAAARFTIGAPSSEATTGDVPPAGDLDLSKTYTIRFKVEAASAEGTFFIYVDNNTTSGANSIHGAGSIIYQTTPNALQVGEYFEVTRSIGTATSFLQLRTNNEGSITLSDLSIVYVD